MKSLFQELSGSFVPSRPRLSARKVTPLADSAQIEAAEASLMKHKRMKALHADPEFKAARARRKAQRIAKRIDELNKQLAAANAIAEAA